MDSLILSRFSSMDVCKRPVLSVVSDQDPQFPGQGAVVIVEGLGLKTARSIGAPVLEDPFSDLDRIIGLQRQNPHGILVVTGLPGRTPGRNILGMVQDVSRSI